MNHSCQDLRSYFGTRFEKLLTKHNQSADGLLFLDDPLDLNVNAIAGNSYKLNSTNRAGTKTEYSQHRINTRHHPNLLVPGLLGSTIGNLVAPFMCSRKQLRSMGYTIDIAWVNGRSGCNANAKTLRNAVLRAADSQGAAVNLIAYSKGCADALHMLGTYPDTHEAVHALVSLAGVVHGTPLANEPSWLLSKLLQYIPLPNVPIGDGRAIVDLSYSVRQQWIKEHPLPAEIYLASIVAVPSQYRISRVLKGSYKNLSLSNPSNDSQVIAMDAILPDSDLLALVNADHWAVALPVKERLPLVAKLLVDKNVFPRDLLLHALIDHLDSVQ